MRSRKSLATFVLVAIIGGMLYPSGRRGISTADAGAGPAKLGNAAAPTEAFAFRVRATLKGSGSREAAVELRVTSHPDAGLRLETSVDGNAVIQACLRPREKMLVLLVCDEKRYLQAAVTDEGLWHVLQEDELIGLVRQSRLAGQALPDRPKGAQADGHMEIEYSPKAVGDRFANARGRLWIDPHTRLPVRLEMEGIAAGGAGATSMQIDAFTWDGAVAPSEIELTIPTDFQAGARPRRCEQNEREVIDGLRAFAALSDGVYPSSLALTTVAQETAGLWPTRSRGRVTEGDFGKLLDAYVPCLSYARLSDQHGGVQYAGYTVTAKDTDGELMRWKSSEETYHVIYGDLRAEDVADRDALLERALALSGAKISPDKRGKALRMLGLSEKDLVRGLGIFLDLSGGRYPRDLHPKVMLKEAKELIAKKYGESPTGQDAKSAAEKQEEIFFASAYYMTLAKSKKDVAYHGDAITIRDSDAVLARWKIASKKYKVIRGDLRTETVAPAQLAELEKTARTK